MTRNVSTLGFIGGCVVYGISDRDSRRHTLTIDAIAPVVTDKALLEPRFDVALSVHAAPERLLESWPLNR